MVITMHKKILVGFTLTTVAVGTVLFANGIFTDWDMECKKWAGSPWDIATKSEGVPLWEIPGMKAVTACKNAVENNRTAINMYRLSRAFYYMKDYKEAASILTEGIAEGHPPSLYNMAVMLANGQGVVKDQSKATSLLRQAGDQGYPKAISLLGFHYLSGIGVAKDQRRARFLFEQAVNLGDEDGHYGMGTIYQHGLGGLATDEVAAFSSYKKGAKEGSINARARLGSFYYLGIGTPIDYDKALTWSRRASRGSFHGLLPEASYNLALIYEKGRGVAISNDTAISHYMMAATNGLSVAAYRLGLIYLKGDLGRDRDFENAFRWTKMGAEQGFSDAQVLLGNMYRDGVGTSSELNMAAVWYQKAAKQGNKTVVAELAILSKKATQKRKNENLRALISLGIALIESMPDQPSGATTSPNETPLPFSDLDVNLLWVQ